MSNLAPKLRANRQKRWRVLLAGGAFALVALCDSLLFVDQFATKVGSGRWVEYAFIVIWGVNAVVAWTGARALWRSARTARATD